MFTLSFVDVRLIACNKNPRSNNDFMFSTVVDVGARVELLCGELAWPMLHVCFSASWSQVTTLLKTAVRSVEGITGLVVPRRMPDAALDRYGECGVAYSLQ